MEIWIVSAILAAAIFLLITEKVAVDLTAIGIMVILMLTGILPPREAVAGFASPAVITVGALFLVSHGMIRTGAVQFVGEKVMVMSRGNVILAVSLILAIVGVASAFINNTPVVVLFIPIVLRICCRLGVSPSKFLIPVSYASILGGTCTLIGTSTNIIVSDISADHGVGSIAMFELATLGVPIALLGILFLVVAAPKLMPDIHSHVCELENREDRKYLAELIITPDSRLAGRKVKGFFARSSPNLEILQLIRDSVIHYPDRSDLKMADGDILLAKGPANELVRILHQNLAKLTLPEQGMNFDAETSESIIVELIVPPQSSLLGQKMADSRLTDEENIHIMAIERSGLHYTEQKVRDVRLKIGDILLIRCTESALARLRGDSDFIIVEDVHHEIVHKHLATRAALVFGAMIVAAATGLADIMVCALAAAFLMVITGCIQLRDSYRSMEGHVLLIIIGMFALSRAMEKTGASGLYAESFLNLFSGSDPVIVLGGLLLLTSISTQLLSNNATAIVLLPIAISMAQNLGVHPKPFIIAICFGASACFATPIGYQTNLLVYGPGGYRFSDYLKLGIPLNLLVLLAGTLFIPYVWPL